MGRSGSGKGTQAAALIETIKKIHPDQGVILIESGNELRKFAKQDSFSAQKTKDVIENGGLMPEFLPVFLWGSVLNEKFTGKEVIIFDGIARRVMEAHVLASVFPFFDMPKPWVIYLDVDHEESTKRLNLRGRHDDKEEDIKKRLGWFETDVKQSLDFFRTDSRFNFLDIHGHGSIEDIHKDIVKKIGLE